MNTIKIINLNILILNFNIVYYTCLLFVLIHLFLLRAPYVEPFFIEKIESNSLSILYTYSNVTSTCTISDLLPSRSGGPQNPKPEETIAWNAPFCAYPQSNSYILLVTI